MEKSISQTAKAVLGKRYLKKDSSGKIMKNRPGSNGGFADMLIKLGISYDSPGAVAQAESVMSVISKESKNASAELAKKRGNFPAYNKSIYNNPQTPFMRNATTTTIAPTGT